MGTKLHPPYPKQTACLVLFWSKKHLQCLKTVGLYNSFGGGRFSFWQSWLTRASRLANSQASALNAGVSTDPYLPESNCLYLAWIWSVKELYSLWASCTVNWFWHDWSSNLNVISNIEDIKDTHVLSQSNLRANWDQQTVKMEKKPPKWVDVSSRTSVSRDQRINYVRLANYANELSGKWLEILREPSCQKLVCEKSKFCKIQGMSKTSKIHGACCMLSAE